MKRPVLTVIVCLLLAAIVWLGLRHQDGAKSPLAAPGPGPIAPSASSSALVPNATPTSEPTPTHEPTAVTIATESPPDQSDSLQTIVLFGQVRSARPILADNDSAGLTVTDHMGARTHAALSEDGNYSVSGLLPGHYWLSASNGSDSQVKATVELSLAENPKRFDLTLSETRSLLVKVMSRNAQPAPKLLAVATLAPLGEWFDEVRGSFNNTFGVGRFRWNGDPVTKLPEEYLGRLSLDQAPPLYVSLVYYQRVIATQHVDADQKEVAFVVDPNSPLLKTGSLRVRFVRADSTAITNGSVMLMGASGGRQLGLDGECFVSQDLMPGDYQVSMWNKALAQPHIDLRIEPGTETDLGDVTLDPEIWISGTVHSSAPTGKRADVICDPYDPAAAPSFESTRYSYGVEADGAFKVPGLGRGLYLLKLAQGSTSGTWARVIDTRAGSVEHVDIDLVTGVPLVVRASGEDWPLVRFRIFDSNEIPVAATRLWSPEPRSLMLAPGEYDVEVRTNATNAVRKHVTIGSEAVELALP